MQGTLLAPERFFRELRVVYRRNTGMTISYQPAGDGERFDFYPARERNELCKLIQATRAGARRCAASDAAGLARARATGSGCAYRCHAGLTDAVIPLQFRTRRIGALYTGQVLTRPPTEAAFRRTSRALEGLGIGRAALRRAFFSAKVVEKERLAASVQLLALIAGHIVALNGELVLQKRVARAARALHRRERENRQLERQLRELSISILERRARRPGPGQAADHERAGQHHLVARAQLFIRSSFRQDIRLADVARAACLSAGYFSSLFKKLTGYSFREYLCRTRLREARRLLRETTMPIKEIVGSVGFGEVSYFTRTFRSHEGMTPAQFRRSSTPA
jgi:AraC-like DNA-binding protein/ligand-binding sensor protein